MAGFGVSAERGVAAACSLHQDTAAPSGRPGGPDDPDPPDGTTRAAALACELRGLAAERARLEGRMLRRVAELAVAVEMEARQVLLAGPRVPDQPSDEEVVRVEVACEVQVVLGVSEWAARELVDLARRLTSALPGTLAALEVGWLDLPRVRVLERATRDLPVELAREVEGLLLPGAGKAPWEGPSPRAWRARVERALARVDAAAARRRREEAASQQLVRSWVCDNGSAELLVAASAEDVAMAEAVISDLAHCWPAVGPDGARLTMDQRRVDALMDLFRRVRDGRGLPALHVRREREIGLVLTTDTLFPPSESASTRTAASGAPAAPAAPAGDPGELRGLRHPVALDPVSAAELARAELARGAGLAVLLTNRDGLLHRVIRLPATPAGGWTRDQLLTAVREALPALPPLATDSYSPTAAIAGQVRARNPRCGWYDCPRSSSRCDLDHDTPWPRGPTDAQNLVPRCRRHHETKTRRLVRTRLDPDGTLTSRMLTGLVVTVRPEPLPGFGPGESYLPDRSTAVGSAVDGPAPAAA